MEYSKILLWILSRSLLLPHDLSQTGKVFALGTCICSFISGLLPHSSFAAFTLVCLVLAHPSLCDVIVFSSVNSLAYRNLSSQDSALDWNSIHLTDIGSPGCNSQFVLVCNNHLTSCLYFCLLTRCFLGSTSQSTFRSEACGAPPAGKHFPPTF